MDDAGDVPENVRELVLQLIAVRNSLTITSVVLREWKCALDLQAQRLARQSTQEILKRHGCQPGAKAGEAGS